MWTKLWDFFLVSTDRDVRLFSYFDKTGKEREIWIEYKNRELNLFPFIKNPNYNFDVLNIDRHLYPLSKDNGITLDDVLRNPQIKWDPNGLSENINVTVEMVVNHSEIKWNLFLFSRNSSVTLEQVKKYSSFPWSWEGLSMNPKMTVDIVKKNLDLPWDFFFFSLNPTVTEAIVKEHPDMEWNSSSLLYNPNFHKPNDTLQFLNASEQKKLAGMAKYLMCPVDNDCEHPYYGISLKPQVLDLLSIYLYDSVCQLILTYYHF